MQRHIVGNPCVNHYDFLDVSLHCQFDVIFCLDDVDAIVLCELSKVSDFY